MAASKISRDHRIMFRLINEQNALLQALLVVLTERGLIDLSEVQQKAEQAKHDPVRAAKVYQNFVALLREIPD